MIKQPFSVEITKLNIDNGMLNVSLLCDTFSKSSNTQTPRMMAVFETVGDSRIMPLPRVVKNILLEKGEKKAVEYSYSYELSSLFWDAKDVKRIKLSFSSSFENTVYDNIEFTTKCNCNNIKIGDKEIFITLEKTLKKANFFSVNSKEKKKRIIKLLFSILFLPFNCVPIKRNRITFLSNRTKSLEDNEKCVYDALIDEVNKESLDIKVFCTPNSSLKNINNIFKFFRLYATSKVVVVNDYYQYISLTPKKKDVKLVQLWHGGGAYKTIGFSRLGTETKLEQSSTNHRQYDAVVAGSKSVVDYYAEGFGISKDKVKLTGIPRSDLFFDKEYGNFQKTEFYKKHPQFKDKKIILFAPTFRGNGKNDCYYPFEKFNIQQILDSAGNDYALIIKLHPYLNHKFTVAAQYENRVIDLTDDYNINDLLFVTDLLITDYSSVVFESSLLKIPTIIYAFDLFDYMEKRDFYVDFYHSLPGKPVFSEKELYNSLKNKDFEQERLDTFSSRYMELESGNSSKNVAKLILDFLN